MNTTSAPAVTWVALDLTRSRLAARQGEALLYLASILAYVVSSALTLTIAGGTWMFYQHWKHPIGIIAELIATEPTFELVGMFYFVLALVACALVVPSIMSLAGSAAVLGARGRERRLATLRLIGLSPSDVTRMSLIDTTIQAVVGVIGGLIVYLVTLPAWQALSLGGQNIVAAEMLLPVYLLVPICVLIVLLGVNAAWWALRQVRISPLGVARRAVRPGLKWWRLVLFVVLIVASIVALKALNLGSDLMPYLIFVGILMAVGQLLNLIGPWLLQQLSKVIALTPSASVMWAARRIQANPKLTWQRVSGLSLMSLIGGFIALMPISFTGPDSNPNGMSFIEITKWDFTKGAIITLAAGFVLAAISIMNTQASAVYERREQSLAISKMGAPRSFSRLTMWLETLGPLTLAVVIGAALGVSLASPMAQVAARQGLESTTGITIMGIVMVVGILMSMAALLASEPLQSQILNEQRRRND